MKDFSFRTNLLIRDQKAVQYIPQASGDFSFIGGHDEKGKKDGEDDTIHDVRAGHESQE